MRASVVLPQPDSPTSASTSPRRTVEVDAVHRLRDRPCRPESERAALASRAASSVTGRAPSRTWTHAARRPSPARQSSTSVVGHSASDDGTARVERAAARHVPRIGRVAREPGRRSSGTRDRRSPGTRRRAPPCTGARRARTPLSLGPPRRSRPAYMTASRRQTYVERREVVRDEDHREPELALESLEQLEHLRLHHHVERGRRLVGDQQAAGCRRARARSARADAGRRRADAGSPLLAGPGYRRARAARRSAPWCPPIGIVELDRLGDLLADALHGIERVQRPLEDDRHARVQRTARRRPGFIVSTSSPSSSTSPVTSVPGGRTRRSAPAIVDFPHPDSPASPSVSPRASVEGHARAPPARRRRPSGT